MTIGPGLKCLDEHGDVLAYGTIHVFERSRWNTRVMAVTYRGPQCEQDFAHPNPVILDNEGRANIYLRPEYYEIELRAADGRLIGGTPHTVVVPNLPRS